MLQINRNQYDYNLFSVNCIIPSCFRLVPETPRAVPISNTATMRQELGLVRDNSEILSDEDNLSLVKTNLSRMDFIFLRLYYFLLFNTVCCSWGDCSRPPGAGGLYDRSDTKRSKTKTVLCVVLGFTGSLS